ncbi:hypothetical protein GCM10027275_18590 [Rhabdobacter roseus]
MYFVRVYAAHSWNGVITRISFNVCVTTPSALPPNDEPVGAVALMVNPDKNCSTSTPGSTIGATQSSKAACQAGRNDDDVWYKFTATQASHIVRLLNITGVYGETGSPYRHIEVFKSASGQPDERIACTGLGDTEALLTGLTAGEVYFVRVYAAHSWNGVITRISFNVCVLTP